MVGHAVPGVVGLQNLHSHLALLQQLTNEDRDQILCFQRIARNFFLKELFETFLQYIQKLRSQSPHVHGNQRIYIHSHAVCFCSSCGLYNILGLHNLSQITLLVHLADATGHTAIIRQRILQHKASHTGLSAIYQILMDSLKAFLAIVIISINDNKRSINHIFSSKDGLTSPPRLCPAFRQNSRDVVDILESVVHSYIMGRANRGNTFTDDLFELFLDILADDKYYMIESSLNCIMNRVIHNDMSGIIHRF